MSSLPQSRKRLIGIVSGAAAVLITISILAISSSSASLDSIQVCDNNKSVSITRASGFKLIQARTPSSPTLKQDTDVSIQPVGIYEFVLTPGSSGHVTMAVDLCPNAFGTNPSRTANYSEVSSLFKSSSSPNYVIDRLNDNASNSDNTLLNGAFQLPGENDQLLIEVTNASSVGLKIEPSDLKKLNSHAIGVTYSITADPRADEATYVISTFYGVCPGEILTIGNIPNNQSLKWSKGPFYGCH